jgi:hypothetical protein
MLALASITSPNRYRNIFLAKDRDLLFSVVLKHGKSALSEPFYNATFPVEHRTTCRETGLASVRKV